MKLIKDIIQKFRFVVECQKAFDKHRFWCGKIEHEIAALQIKDNELHAACRRLHEALYIIEKKANTVNKAYEELMHTDQVSESNSPTWKERHMVYLENKLKAQNNKPKRGRPRKTSEGTNK